MGACALDIYSDSKFCLLKEHDTGVKCPVFRADSKPTVLHPNDKYKNRDALITPQFKCQL